MTHFWTKLSGLKIYRSAYYLCFLRLRLHAAIYRPDSFVLMLHYCANLKAIRYELTSLNKIVADKSHPVIVALQSKSAALQDSCIFGIFS